MGTLLLGAVSPATDNEFLYAGKFEGEAARLLDAAGIDVAGKPAESVLSEFQRRGFFLTHILECPHEVGTSHPPSSDSLFEQRLPSVITRIRKSLKPKRIILISELLAPVIAKLSAAELACPLILHRGNPFGLDSDGDSQAVSHLSEVLSIPF